jgi:hypothetical protein
MDKESLMAFKNFGSWLLNTTKASFTVWQKGVLQFSYLLKEGVVCKEQLTNLNESKKPNTIIKQAIRTKTF